MSRTPPNPRQHATAQPRSERLKAALKANLARRKDQGRKRAEASDTNATDDKDSGHTTEG